nr:hypothetical protein pPsy0462a_00046 [Pseudomonas syringae]
MGGRASADVIGAWCRHPVVLAVLRHLRVLDLLDALLAMENGGLPFIHVWAGGKINLLAEVANNAKDVTFSEWLEVMNHTSGVLLLFLTPLVIVSGIGLAQHPVLPFRSKRLVNIHTLPGLLSHFAPSVIPVLARQVPMA